MFRFSRLSLPGQLALWSLVAVLLITGALAMVAASVARADLRHAAEASQAALVDGVARDIDDKLQARRDALLRAASIVTVGAGGIDAEAMRRQLAGQPILQGLFDVLLVSDAAGVIRADTPALAGRVGRSLADRDYFRRLMASGEPVISAPVANLTTGEPTVVFAAPLRGADGRVAGMLAGTLMLTRPNFLGSLATRRIGERGYFYLASRPPNAILVLHPQPGRTLKPVPDAQRNPHLHRAYGGFEGTVEGHNSVGLHALMTFRALGSVPWILGAVYPTAEAYAPIKARQAQILGVAAGVAVLAGAGMWLLAMRLSRPLRRLQRRMLGAVAGDDREVVLDGGTRDVVAVVEAYNALRRHKAAAEQRLAASEQRLRTITDNVPALIAYIDAGRRYRFCNATYADWFQQPLAQIVDQSVDALGMDDVQRRELERALAGERGAFTRALALPGGERHVQGVYLPDLQDGVVRGVYALGFDVTEAKRHEDLLLHQARHDALTGLPNRRLFEERLGEALARARRGRPMALLYLDIDRFKQINDSRGHAAGDAVLRGFAARLEGAVRETDTVARLAGDEFVIVAEGLGGTVEAQAVACKVLQALLPPLALTEGEPVALSASIGVAFSDGHDAPDVLMQRADEALYAAKNDGRNIFRGV